MLWFRHLFDWVEWNEFHLCGVARNGSIERYIVLEIQECGLSSADCIQARMSHDGEMLAFGSLWFLTL